MGKYFDDVKFPELDQPAVEEKKEVDDDLSKLDLIKPLTEIRRMIVAIESGESQIVPGARRLGSSPLVARLQSFEQQPTLTGLKRVLETAEQDVNRRFRKEVVKVFKVYKQIADLMEENNIE